MIEIYLLGLEVLWSIVWPIAQTIFGYGILGILFYVIYHPYDGREEIILRNCTVIINPKTLK